MPIYEYECKDCGHVFDALQKMSDAPLRDCPDCDKPELKKLLSAPNFRLKGGGWYETDFKDKNKRNLAGSDSDSSSKPSESGSESGKKGSNSGDSKKDTGKKSESSASPAAKPVNKSD